MHNAFAMWNSADLLRSIARLLKDIGLMGKGVFLRSFHVISVSLLGVVARPAHSPQASINTIPSSSAPHSAESTRISTSADNPLQTSTTTSPLDHNRRLIASLLTSYPSATAVLDGSVDFSQDLSHVDQVTLVPHSTGGFSDVYQAKLTRESNEIQVAIKVLRPVNINHDTQERLVRRMLREIRVWKSLEHRHILPLLGYAILDSTPCLISPWCRNGTVLEYLKRFPNTDKLALVLQVCEGLVFLHNSQPPIVHSDLKGNNVLVNDAGGAMLSDFGLSRFLGATPSGLSTSPMGMGAIRWRAPELFADSSESTTQSDIYSFGCLVLEIITRSIPFRKYETDISLIRAKLAGEEIAPADYPELHEDDPLWSIMGRCWVRDPAERPTSKEVFAELRSLQSSLKQAQA